MTQQPDTCLFCRILSGTEPASFVHSDEQCTAFMDLVPINPGHVLVVPNRHATYLADIAPATAGHLMQTGQRLAGALRASGHRCEGVNLFLADGAAAGQEVFHVHLHVIPRFRGDDFGVRFGPNRVVRAREELDEAGAMIQQVLQGKPA